MPPTVRDGPRTVTISDSLPSITIPNYTVTGGVLIVLVTRQSTTASDCSAVRFGTHPLTKVVDSGIFNMTSWIYYLRDPPIETADVRVNWFDLTSMSGSATAVTFDGVDPRYPTDHMSGVRPVEGTSLSITVGTTNNTLALGVISSYADPEAGSNGMFGLGDDEVVFAAYMNGWHPSTTMKWLLGGTYWAAACIIELVGVEPTKSSGLPPIKLDDKVYFLMSGTYQKTHNEALIEEAYTLHGDINREVLFTGKHRWSFTLLVPILRSNVILSNETSFSKGEIGIRYNLHAAADKEPPSDLVNFCDVVSAWDLSSPTHKVYIKLTEESPHGGDIGNWEIPVELWGKDYS